MRISILVLAATAAMFTGCRHNPFGEQTEANVNSFNTLHFEKENIKVKVANGTASFFYLDAGKLLPYKVDYEGTISAKPRGPKDQYDLFFLFRGRKDPEHIGIADKDTPKICDTYKIDGETFDFPCDATFNHPDPKVQTNGKLAQPSVTITLAQYGGKGGDALPQLTSGLGLASDNDIVDLSAWTQNQIDQHSTGTCLYNDTTGTLEWFVARLRGGAAATSADNLAEADVLGTLGHHGTEPEIHAWEFANQLGYVAKESVAPTTTSYTFQPNDFNTVWNWARGNSSAWSQQPRVDLNFKLRGTLLYWFGRNRNGGVTQQQVDSIRIWLQTHKTPVQIFANYSGIWHAILVTGVNPQDQTFKIRDSLGNTTIKGTWQSYLWIQQFTYGAVGIDANVALPPIGSTQTTQTTGQTPATTDTSTTVTTSTDTGAPAGTDTNTQTDSIATSTDSSTSDTQTSTDTASNPGLGSGSAGKTAPSDADKNSCYLGWVANKTGANICSMWNINDSQAKGSVYAYLPVVNSTQNGCNIYAFMNYLGTTRYQALLTHCANRYRVWTGRY